MVYANRNSLPGFFYMVEYTEEEIDRWLDRTNSTVYMGDPPFGCSVWVEGLVAHLREQRDESRVWGVGQRYERHACRYGVSLETIRAIESDPAPWEDPT